MFTRGKNDEPFDPVEDVASFVMAFWISLSVVVFFCAWSIYAVSRHNQERAERREAVYQSGIVRPEALQVPRRW